MHCFFHAYFFSFLAIVYALDHEKAECLEKEKALALLETAESLLSKALKAFPSCNLTSKNNTDCSGEKPLAYIEISKKLISDVRENFPKCPYPIEKNDTIVPKPIEKDDKTTPQPIEEDDKTTPEPIAEDDRTTTKPIEKDDKILRDDNSTDCSEILASGRNESGVYTIWPRETNKKGKSFQVYCDMDTDDGGWTVIQRRGKYPVRQDFYQDWESYKNGFGNLTEAFWLGNENIQVLCHGGCEIRFDLRSAQGEKGFARYRNFQLLFNTYILSISGYTGNVGDSMKQHDTYGFSTKDQGLTERAKLFHGGWWYRESDFFTNLNGIFQPGTALTESAFWYTWKEDEGLASVEMKVRPNKT